MSASVFRNALLRTVPLQYPVVAHQAQAASLGHDIARNTQRRTLAHLGAALRAHARRSTALHASSAQDLHVLGMARRHEEEPVLQAASRAVSRKRQPTTSGRRQADPFESSVDLSDPQQAPFDDCKALSGLTQTQRVPVSTAYSGISKQRGAFDSRPSPEPRDSTGAAKRKQVKAQRSFRSDRFGI